MVKPIIVKNKEGLLQTISGLTIIAITFIANGFLSFIVVGFDFSNIFTGEFWANFVTLFASEMAVLFGMFIIQKQKDLQKSKIVDLQKHINNKREIIYGVDKVTEAEEWLREIYNYREKLFLFEDKIRKLHSKIIVKEPKEGCKGYARKLKIYNKKIELREYYKLQLDYIKVDKERLKEIVKSAKNGINNVDTSKYDEQINHEKYAFKTAKIQYKDVYWGNLLSDNEESKERQTTPFFNEKKEVSKNIVRYFGFGLLSTGLLSALTFPAIRGFDWGTVVKMAFNALTLITFISRGASLSNKIILGTYYRALEKRKSIYNQMLTDLGISKIIIEESNGNEQ